MWAKTILNVENILQMSYYIPNVGVISTVGKICYTAFYWEIRYAEQGSKAVHKKVHLVKVRGKLRMLDSSSRAKSALIMLLKDILYTI